MTPEKVRNKTLRVRKRGKSIPTLMAKVHFRRKDLDKKKYMRPPVLLCQSIVIATVLYSNELFKNLLRHFILHNVTQFTHSKSGVVGGFPTARG